jgi:hypothetical protein
MHKVASEMKRMHKFIYFVQYNLPHRRNKNGPSYTCSLLWNLDYEGKPEEDFLGIKNLKF